MINSHRLKLIIAITILVQPAYWTYLVYIVQQPDYLSNFNNQLEIHNKELGATPVELRIDSPIQECGYFKQSDYNDAGASEQRQTYLDRAFSILQFHISKFNLLPTSTLHTYLDPNQYILYKKCEWPFELAVFNNDKDVINNSDYAHRSSVINKNTTWEGRDFYNSFISGLEVIGSYDQSDSDVGELVVALRRGEKLLYRSGPNTSNQRMILIDGDTKESIVMPVLIEWSILDFSNPDLPYNFLLQFSDAGRDYGEWSAVALNNR